jgi:ParB family chromosome partitioning protein
VIRHKLTVRQLERRVSASRHPPPRFSPGKPGDWERLERELSDLVGCPVAITLEKAGRGELRVSFHSLDELDGVLGKLGYEAR